MPKTTTNPKTDQGRHMLADRKQQNMNAETGPEVMNAVFSVAVACYFNMYL